MNSAFLRALFLAGIAGLVPTVACSGADAPEARGEAWLASLSRDGFEVDALGAKLKTPQEAFAYVRDRIAYEPYAGVMKGAAGALLTHGANDCDRSLLLAALLAAQGLEPKIVFGTVPGNSAGAPLAGALRHTDAVGLMLATLPQPAAPPAPLSFAQKVRRETFAHQSADRRTRMRDEARLQAELLKAVAGRISAAAPAPPARRVWVQVAVEGATIDLDASSSEAKYGQAPASVDGTWDGNTPPDGEEHSLTVRVVRDTLAQGRLTRSEIVSHDFKSSELVNRGFRIVIAPAAAGDTADEFQVTLVSPDETLGEGSFRISGEKPKPADAPGAGGLLGGFGGGGGNESDAPAPDSQLARLQVEIVFHSPGQPDETERRTILDRVEPQGDSWRLVPAWAEAGKVRPVLLQAWDGAVDVGAPHLYAWIDAEAGALRNVTPWRTALTSSQELNPDDLPGPGLSPQLSGFFFTSGLARHRMAAASGFRLLPYFARPRLAFLRHGYVRHDWSESAPVAVQYAEGIDVVNEPVCFFGSTAYAGLFALRAGISDTILEQFVLHDPLPFNAVPALAAARAQKLPLATVSSASDLAGLRVPAAIRTAMSDDLAHGRLILAPTGPVELAQTHAFPWWSIDPRTGAALGRMDVGGGQAMMEFSKVTETVGSLAKVFGKLMGNMIRCYGGAIGSAMAGGGKGSKSDEVKLLKCLRAAACEALKDFYGLAKSSFPSDQGAWKELVTEEHKEIELLDEAISEAEESEASQIKESIGDMSDTMNGMAGPDDGGDDNQACQTALGGGG